MNQTNLLTFIFLFTCFWTTAQNTSNVKIDVHCQRYIGDVSELDRTKYFSVHDSGNDTEQSAFRNDYNVTGGRQFWGPYGYAYQASSGTASERKAGVYPGDRSGNDALRFVNKGYVVTSHPRTAFIDNLDIDAAADWAVEYFKDYENDTYRQEFFEVMNEPFVHAHEFYDGWNADENTRIKRHMAAFYNKVAQRIHETPALADVKVIGYSSAWPSMELWDFGHWEDNMKLFMDIAGDNMYAFSTHLYDGINVTGQDTKRSGSNSEAILDLIENYSYIKWGTIKPHAITEYGAIEEGYGDDYSDIASAQTMASINHILFNLLDREDRLVNSIPFITGKATWHITEANNWQPYQAVLWKPTNIGEPVPDGWEYTPRIHFYELWKDVKGKRTFIRSDNPDVQTHAFLDTNSNKLYVCLSNLDDATQTVNLTYLSSMADISEVKIKALKIYPQALPDMSETMVNDAPDSIDLIKDETVVLEYTFNNSITFDNALRTKHYYTQNYLQPITANSVITYNFNNVTIGNGFGTLRMAIGRKHNVSKAPVVKINGITVDVPDNWKGYDQANRDDFFGMIEIPFQASLLKENNEVTLEFPDTGGRVSSLILSVDLLDNADDSSILGSVLSTGNPCPGSTEGMITVSPMVADDLAVNITGNGLNDTYDLNNKLEITGLASGTYTIIITSKTNPDLKTEYEATISEPDPLSVTNKIDVEKQSVSYNLSGGNNYNITFNDRTFTTSASSIELPLQTGNNKIVIKTDKNCQGIYEDNLFFNTIMGYPNPFKDKLTIDLGLDNSKRVTIQLYDPLGTLVYGQTHHPKNGKIELNSDFLKDGLYIVTVKTQNTSRHLKTLKMVP
ncbi:T9SS type A sorting domain-containing protein [Seonamhaeicola sp.]|uniref:T9SS type A sorting domain-containing protein n=1 Tax=Seonamhaeicola sp. TaxID=1912245 RepID=UPI0026158FC3|nr:T9SS type A sorting domain-containing protein [Seonamhaeicola sp.]